MRFTFGFLRKGEKEPARLNQPAGVELTEAELKHVWGGASPFTQGESGHNTNSGKTSPGQSNNPQPGK